MVFLPVFVLILSLLFAPMSVEQKQNEVSQIIFGPNIVPEIASFIYMLTAISLDKETATKHNK